MTKGLCPHYKDELVNAVEENDRSSFWDSYQHINTVCGKNADIFGIKSGGNVCVETKLP
jgi:hypothetical protein